jgi:ribosomal protein S18 acetylase RimI-like enzyme
MDLSGLHVRPALPADLDAIVGVHTLARNAYYLGHVPSEDLTDPAAYQRRRATHQQRMQDPACIVLCAELDRRVTGFALLGPPHEPAPEPGAVGQLRQIHVHPDCWRQGIGSALHQACVHAWQASSVTTGRVDVWSKNPRARAFYAAHGWQPGGHRRPGPAGFDYLRLCLPIPPA